MNVLDMAQNHAGALENVEYSYIAIVPTSTLVVADRVISTGQIELTNVLMINSIVWNREIFTMKLNLR